MMARLAMSALAISLVLSECKTARAAEDQNIAAQMQAFAITYNSADWAAMRSFYATDIILIPPNGSPVEGRNGAVELWMSYKKTGIKELVIVSSIVQVEGKLAYQTGSYSMKVADQNQEIPVKGALLTVWQQQTNGGWLIKRFAWNVISLQ